MARKKRTPTPPPLLPLSKGEIWEVGRRPLSAHVLELAQCGERPEIFLAIQVGEAGGVLLAEPVTSAKPWTALGDFTLQAMQRPLLGPPRRPEMIRIASQPEAESLAVALAGMGLALEVCHELHTLDLVHSELEREFSGMTNDYRTQAAQAGEILSVVGLQAFFRAARQLYREEMWQSYSDDTMFEIVLERAGGPAQTYYGIFMGSMGTEFGLVLYPSIEALQQFYDASMQHLEHFDERSHERDRYHADRAQIQRDAECRRRPRSSARAASGRRPPSPRARACSPRRPAPRRSPRASSPRTRRTARARSGRGRARGCRASGRGPGRRRSTPRRSRRRRSARRGRRRRGSCGACGSTSRRHA